MTTTRYNYRHLWKKWVLPFDQVRDFNIFYPYMKFDVCFISSSAMFPAKKNPTFIKYISIDIIAPNGRTI